jgi:hypothetical protein
MSLKTAMKNEVLESMRAEKYYRVREGSIWAGGSANANANGDSENDGRVNLIQASQVISIDYTTRMM